MATTAHALYFDETLHTIMWVPSPKDGDMIVHDDVKQKEMGNLCVRNQDDTVPTATTDLTKCVIKWIPLSDPTVTLHAISFGVASMTKGCVVIRSMGDAEVAPVSAAPAVISVVEQPSSSVATAAHQIHSALQSTTDEHAVTSAQTKFSMLENDDDDDTLTTAVDGEKSAIDKPTIDDEPKEAAVTSSAGKKRIGPPRSMSFSSSTKRAKTLVMPVKGRGKVKNRKHLEMLKKLIINDLGLTHYELYTQPAGLKKMSFNNGLDKRIIFNTLNDCLHHVKQNFMIDIAKELAESPERLFDLDSISDGFFDAIDDAAGDDGDEPLEID